MVAITAWHGGELVYRHGLGVISLPISQHEFEHDHHHEGHEVQSLEDSPPDDHEHSQHDHTH